MLSINVVFDILGLIRKKNIFITRGTVGMLLALTVKGNKGDKKKIKGLDRGRSWTSDDEYLSQYNQIKKDGYIINEINKINIHFRPCHFIDLGKKGIS